MKKGFSFVGETDSHFEIDHPKDGRIKIAKRALGEEMEDRIRAMPKVKGYAEGGTVEGAAAEEPGFFSGLADWFQGDDQSQAAAAARFGLPAPGALPPPQQFGYADMSPVQVDRAGMAGVAIPAAARMGPPKSFAMDAPGFEPQPGAQTAAELVPESASSQTSPIPTGLAPEGTTGTAPPPGAAVLQQVTALGEQRDQAIRAAAGAESQAQEAIAKVQADQQAKLKQQQDYEQHVLAGIDGESDRLAKDYGDGKIDPRRVWNQASTGNKILAGIGVLLSGIGSGLTGQPNMAMKIINDSIDRDIDAQKSEQAKKYNLYQFNLRKYGTAQAAFAATKVQMTAMVNAQIAETAAKMGSQAAIARAEGQIAENNMKLLPFKMQLAQSVMQQQMTQGINSGAGGYSAEQLQANPYTKDKWVRTIGAGGAKEGGILITMTPEDRKKVIEVQTGAYKARELMAKMRAFQDHVGRTGWGTENAAYAESLRLQMIPQLNEMAGLSKNMSDSELELLVGPQVPNVGDWNQAKVNGRLKSLEGFIDRNLGAAYRNYSINNAQPHAVTDRRGK